jgi:uncharacterized protein (DUF1330 family)
MADIPVYMLVNLKVTDADEYRKYEKGFFGILKRYGGPVHHLSMIIQLPWRETLQGTVE